MPSAFAACRFILDDPDLVLTAQDEWWDPETQTQFKQLSGGAAGTN